MWIIDIVVMSVEVCLLLSNHEQDRPVDDDPGMPPGTVSNSDSPQGNEVTLFYCSELI